MQAQSPTLASIINCFLNMERFISECVESVLRQEYPHWELLLIDDGSTDHSTAMAKKYIKAYPGKIFYYEHDKHKNKGLNASRNLGLTHAKGDLLTFLDADDVWLPGRLSQHLAIWHRIPNLDMICEASEYWYTWRDPTQTDTVIPVGTAADRLYSPPQLLLNLYPLGKGDAPCTCAITLKKSLIIQLGGFDENFNGYYALYEDQSF